MLKNKHFLCFVKDIGNPTHYLKGGRGEGLIFYWYFIVSFKKMDEKRYEIVRNFFFNHSRHSNGNKVWKFWTVFINHLAFENLVIVFKIVKIYSFYIIIECMSLKLLWMLMSVLIAGKLIQNFIYTNNSWIITTCSLQLYLEHVIDRTMFSRFFFDL